MTGIASRENKDNWNRPYILSFMEFYPMDHAWLFGGTFEVLNRLSKSYVIGDYSKHSKFEGRLICRFKRPQGMRGRGFLLERYIGNIKAIQILPEIFTGEVFPGYQNVNHTLSFLRSIVDRDRLDWKVPLQAVKGVYLVFNSDTGKAYVGSAYGDAAIWSRLSSYVHTGHGWNDDLVTTIQQVGLNYALTHFRFSVLEVFTHNTPDKTIQGREAHWKRVLHTREFGHNKN